MLGEMLTRYAKALASGKSKWVERKTAKGMVKGLLSNLSNRTQKDFLASRTESQGSKLALVIDGKRALKLSKSEKAAA